MLLKKKTYIIKLLFHATVSTLTESRSVANLRLIGNHAMYRHDVLSVYWEVTTSQAMACGPYGNVLIRYTAIFGYIHISVNWCIHNTAARFIFIEISSQVFFKRNAKYISFDKC